MNVINLWKNIGSQIGVYTKETARQIPEKAGIYGWFIPLWIVDENLSDYIQLINRFYMYSPDDRDTPQETKRFDFNWESIDVELKKGAGKKTTPSNTTVEQWNNVMSGEDSHRKEILEQSLMKASLFMPPLYVGKANNLRSRYSQHIEGGDGSKNTFNKRFTDYAKKVNLQFSISDLLFICISTEEQNSLDERKTDNELIEQVVMRLCRPTFSIK